MALRIGPEADLSGMSPAMRRQVEAALAETRDRDARLSGDPTRSHRPARRARPEQEAGRALVDWMDRLVLVAGFRPGTLFAHIPNGGARTGAEAAILKGQGVRAGWPDYHLALACYIGGRQYHGAFVELKAADAGKPDEAQLEVLERLERGGHFVRVAWGFEDARMYFREYLDPLWPDDLGIDGYPE